MDDVLYHYYLEIHVALSQKEISTISLEPLLLRKHINDCKTLSIGPITENFVTHGQEDNHRHAVTLK